LEALRPVIGRDILVSHAEIGFAALAAHGSTIPDAVVAQAKTADAVLLGPVSHNAYPAKEDGGLNPSGVLRKALDLYANIRPARVWDGLEAPSRKPFDLIVARENLEGFYADRNMHEGAGEFSPVPGVALAIRRITTEASLRIARKGFELAAQRPAKRVAAIHKANVMRLSDGVFLDAVRAVAAEYPDIAYEEVLVDAAAALLVRDASRFDVLMTPNLFGDILSDLASELAGGLGLAGSLNVGPQHVAAQAQHGSAPDIAGQNKANPVSLILSLGMCLRHFDEEPAADALERAIAECLRFPATRTVDLGGALGTIAFTDQLISKLEASSR
jgi:3-isopropylmalate dehydrogenase